jgi:uncharacterized protein (TIGR02001 family)
MNKVIAILMLVSTSAFADISGHIGYSSDYVFRGVNQTTESGALSLSLEAESNGFYTGIWASEVDFGDIVSYEYDYYVGFAFALTQNVSVDLGIIQYNFDELIEESEEMYIGVSVNNFSGYLYENIDNDDTFAELSYLLPFIDFVDTEVIYGYHDEDNDYAQLRFSKSFDNGISTILTVGRTEQLEVYSFRESAEKVFFSLLYNF